MVHRHPAPGARVQIYGLLEARLADTDRVVLGGLVEGVWPPEVGTDPWLSRPMRQQLGSQSAGAAHRPHRPRLRADVRRPRRHPHPRQQAWRRADRRLALPATVGHGGRRALAGRGGARRAIWQLGARARSPRYGRPDQAAGTAAAARRAPDLVFGHRDRELAARSLHDLRQAHPAPAPARSGRYVAGRRRTRQRDP